MHRIFISDLHLDESLTRVTATFFHFLETKASECDELYILGDLFNFWIGDGEKSPYQLEVASHIAKVKARKFFIPGNRDFLIGFRYSKRCKMKILKDETVIRKAPQPYVICHGDGLCTLDHGYIKFRKFRSNPLNRFIYALLPYSTKQHLANNIRTEAAHKKRIKDPAMMDIVQEDFFRLMNKKNCKICVHGHTHKPQVHQYQDQGLTRYVLGDWNENGFFYLDENNGEFQLLHENLI